jgi:hypothetical protein
MDSDLHQTHYAVAGNGPVDGAVSGGSSLASLSDTNFKKPSMAQYQSRLTKDHLVILGLYPLTAIFGSLVQVISQPGPSYFSSKSNLLNLVFVKHGGWVWVTALTLLYLLGSPAVGGILATGATRKRTVALRFVAVTMWWFFFSQWCFGLPLMDKVFVITGGGCAPVAGTASASAAAVGTLSVAATSAACRSQGGAWVGGIDPSGHMFLLSFASLFIWFDILLPSIMSSSNNGSNNNSGSNTTSSSSIEAIEKRPYSLVTKLAFFLVAIYWWMVLMTNVYSFHTTFERLAGITWSYLGIALIYFVGPTLPALHGILYE